MAHRRRRGLLLVSPMLVVRRLALQRGILGGGRVWTAVAVVVYGTRILRRVLGRNEVVVARDELTPGQGLVVRALGRSES